MKIKNLVGVDTHEDSLACFCNRKFKEFKTNKVGFKQVINWAKSSHEAIEGAYGFGQAYNGRNKVTGGRNRKRNAGNCKSVNKNFIHYQLYKKDTMTKQRCIKKRN